MDNSRTQPNVKALVEHQTAQHYCLTLGKSLRQASWPDQRALTWQELQELLTDHKEGSKDGSCVVPAILRQSERKAEYTEEIGLLFLDSDCGHTLPEIETKLRALGFAALIYSTHSHMTTRTTIKRSEFESRHLTAEQYLIRIKKYLPGVATDARVLPSEGDDLTLEHQSCPKYRVVLSLDRPWRASEYPDQTAAIETWRERYKAAAHYLGLVVDPACSDTNRLFFLPRHSPGAPFETLVLEGEDLRIWDLPGAPQENPATTESKPATRIEITNGDSQDVIGAFNREFTVESQLERYGYKKIGNKYLAPSSSTREPGVSVKDGRVFSHHSSDPLFTGDAKHAHDGFSIFRIWEHGGDVKAAVKAAARLLNIEPNRSRSGGNGHCADWGWPEGYTKEAGQPGKDNTGAPLPIERTQEESLKYSSKKGTAPDSPEKSCFFDIDLNKINASRFIDSEPEPLRWILTGSLLAGRYGMLVADGGTGKGFVALQMGISVSTGLPFLDGLFDVPESGKVVLIFGEDDDLIIHHRLDGTLRSFGEDTTTAEFLNRLRTNLHVVSVCGQDSRLIQSVGGHILPTKAYEDLLNLLKSIENLKLAILDPLSRFYVGDENNAPEATYFCSLLERLAQETGATVLASQHTNKASGIGKESLTQHAIRGSSGFTNAARWQLNLARVNPAEWRSLGIPAGEINRYLVAKVTKKNMGPPENHFYLKRDANGTLRRAHVKEGVSDRDKEVLTDILDILGKRVESTGSEGKRYTKRSFARDFAKCEQWPDYGSHKIEKLIDYALDDGVLGLTPAKNLQGVMVDYLSVKQGTENSYKARI